MIKFRPGEQRILYANHSWRLGCGEICVLGPNVYIIRSKDSGKSITDSIVEVIMISDFRLCQPKSWQWNLLILDIDHVNLL